MVKNLSKQGVVSGDRSLGKTPKGRPRKAALEKPTPEEDALEPEVLDVEAVRHVRGGHGKGRQGVGEEQRGDIIEIEPVTRMDVPAVVPAVAPPGDSTGASSEPIDGQLEEEGELGAADVAEVEAEIEELGEVGPASGSESAESEKFVPTHYDPLTAYLREIRSYPALSREEEHELGVRYYTTKDVEAAYRLVTSNLWLVVKIARDYERAARGLLDLVQEGNIGLMEAVKNFDPYRGVRFPSYAVWWIKAYMVRYLIANWRMVKIGTTQAQRKLFFNLKKEKERLEREGFAPAPKLLAERLNVKESEVVEMEQRLGSSDVSVDAPLQPGESDTSLLGILPSPESSVDTMLDRRRSQELLKQGLDDFEQTLKDKEKLIFRERMLGDEKATLQEISDKIGVSRERVRQIETRLREKLKKFLEERLGGALEALDVEP